MLLMVLMGMLVTDVAVRRIRWDWPTMKHWALAGAAMIQSFTTTRKIDAQQTMAALKKVHRHPERKHAMAMEVITRQTSPSPVQPLSRTKGAPSSLNRLKLAKHRALEEIRHRQQREGN
jgi:hypothetical protein